MEKYFIVLFLCVLIIISCKQHKTACPFDNAFRSEILVADTAIMKSYITDDQTMPTNRTYDGFMDTLSRPMHVPLSAIKLNDLETKRLLGIFTVANNNLPLKACAPVFRHSIVFFDKKNLKLGHIGICIDCLEVYNYPNEACRYYVNHKKFGELLIFLKQHGVYFRWHEYMSEFKIPPPL